MKEDQHERELDERPIEVKEVYKAPKEDSSPMDIDVSGEDNMDLSPITFSTEQSGFNISHAQEETRAKIAHYFTRSFLILLVVSLLIPFVVDLIDPSALSSPLESSKELVTIVASVLAGPFGFIVGFYFKQRED